MSEYEQDERQEVDLSNLGLKVSIPTQEQIIEGIAKSYIRDYTNGQKLREAVAERVADLVREAVDTLAREHIVDILFRPVQQTDNLGNPVGNPIAMNAMLMAQIKNWQEETVDAYGKPARKDSYSNVTTRAEYIMKQAVVPELQKEVKAAVDNIRASATAMLKTRMSEAISSAIAALSK